MAQSFDQKSVFVALSNLPPVAAKQDIQRLIDCEAATFKLGKMHKDETTLQYCEVELFNERDVRNVLGLNGKIFMGYEVTVKKLVPQENPLEVFIRRVPVHATETDIGKLFAQFGKIDEITLPRWHDSGKPRGFGFIRFVEESSANEAIKYDGQLTLHGSRLSIRPNRRMHIQKKQQSPKERVSKRMTERPEGCTTIYVGNVDFEATEQQISKLFSVCGAVLNVRVVRQQFTNRSRGFAYIEFGDEESVTKAVNMDGQEFLGRKIRVDYAEPFDPTRSQTRNFSTFTPATAEGNRGTSNYPDRYIPTPSSFIMEHFVDNPWAGMAALAGCMNEQQHQLQHTVQLAQQQQQLIQMATQQFGTPFLPNYSMPMMAPMSVPTQAAPIPAIPAMPQFPNYYTPAGTHSIYNVTPSGEPVQIDATLFTQGIPGIGQFLAPYAMLTQRAAPLPANQVRTTMQAKPPAKAPVPSTQPQRSAASQAKLPFLHRSFTPHDVQSFETRKPAVSSLQQTISGCVDSSYVICSDTETEPWESREVDNDVLY